jgi:hypothetical protein
VDPAVHEHTAPVEGPAVPPPRGAKGGFFLELDQPQRAHGATIDQRFTLAHGRHKAIVLCDHQGDAGLPCEGQYLLALGQRPGDGLLHQHVFAGLRRQGHMLPMQVMRCAQVQGLHPRVGRRGGIGAKAPMPPEGGGVGPRPRPITAREEERDLVP